MFRRLSLRQGYVLALALIFILATLKFAAMETLVIRQDGAATVINVSGRQRMLSQRTAFYTSALIAADNEQSRTELRPALLETVREFESNHHDLIQGNEKRGLPALNNDAIFDIYYDGDPALDSLVDAYIESVQTVLNANGEGPDAEKAYQYILDVGPHILLQKLNTVVQLHEKAARDDVQLVKTLQQLFWLITIIVLFLEAAFLFHPMVRRIENNIRELQKREKKIKTQFKELQEFTHIASHDLQEPLRKIISFTDRLEQTLHEKLDDKTQTYMQFITSSSNHMRDLVNGLHAYSRISANDEDLDIVDASLAVKKAIKAYEEQINDVNATIEYNNLPSIPYNQAMLFQVFDIFIDNAIKYRGANDLVVHITAEDKNDSWVFCIADNGVGIEEKFFERIFIMFQRLHRKEDIPGIGLGLAIAKKIIERHGGSLWMQSAPEQGTKFYFSVPKHIGKKGA